MDIPVESLDAIAEGLRKFEAPFKAEGNPRGLWWGAAASAVEEAAAEIRRLTAERDAALDAAAFALKDRDKLIRERDEALAEANEAMALHGRAVKAELGLIGVKAELDALRAENDMMRSLIIDAPTKEERDALFERRFGSAHEQRTTPST
jgi:hypothetical protein